MDDGYIVLITTGFQRGTKKRPGQLVRATILFSGGGGEEAIGFSGSGQYLNNLADARLQGRTWRVAKRLLSPGDSVRFDVFTGQRGAGELAELTGTWIYVMSPAAPIQEVRIQGVGPKEYPLAKGRLVPVGSVTHEKVQKDELQQLFDDESGM